MKLPERFKNIFEFEFITTIDVTDNIGLCTSTTMIVTSWMVTV